MVTTATRGMAIENLKAALASTNLTIEQKKQILIANGLSKEEAEAAIATNAHSAANVGATTTTGFFTAAITSLKTAIKGLWTALTANPLLWVAAGITVCITAFSKLNSITEENYKKAAEQAQESKEKTDSLIQETNSLSELINKYKELSKADTTDSTNRAKIKDIQDEINKLVDTQAENLDLVNGKLDEELVKLKNIQSTQLQTNISTFEKAYMDASDESVKKTFHNANIVKDLYSDFSKDSNVITFDYWGDDENRDKAVEIIDEVWKEKGYGSAFVNYEEYLLGFGDSFTQLTFNENLSLQEKINAINDAIEALENTDEFDYNNNQTWKELVEINNALSGGEGVFTKQIEAAKTFLNELIMLEVENNNADINSLEDYEKYRQEIIDNIFSNKTISQAIKDEALSNDAIETEIDTYLASLDEFSNYYNEWYNKFLSDTAEHTTEVKEKFANGILNKNNIVVPLTESIENEDLESTLINSLNKVTTYFSSLSGNVMQEIAAFNKWMDKLSDSDKEIVYTISTKFTSDKVKSQLEEYSEGGTVNLTLRPQIDNSELKNAGWDVSSDGTETIFSSTFSNDNGTVAINFTPIVVDENGKYIETLSPEALQEYAEGVINGTREDDLKLQIGAEFTGSDAIDQATKAAEKIHLLQDYFYLKGDISDFSLYDWKVALEEYKTELSEVANNTAAFEKLLTEEGTDEEPSFSERIDDYMKKINTLKETLSKVQSGEFSEQDLTELLPDFPVLAAETENLDAAIVELINTTNTGMLDDFSNQFGNMETEADVQALENLKTAILDFGNIDSDLALTMNFEAASNSIQDVVSAFDTVKSVIEAYNENGYLTISNLKELLSLDDSYLVALTNEQGALDLTTEKYKKLVKAQGIQLKASLLQEAIDSVNSINTQAKALEYLEGCQIDAANSALNLADAKWQEALATATARDISEGTGDLYQRVVYQARDVYDTQIALIDSYIDSTTTIGELATTTDGYKDSLEAEKEALESAKKSLEDNKSALEDTKNNYEDAMNSIKDLIDWTEKYIKQTKEDEIESLEEKRQSIDNLVESQKELLQAEKDEYEWNKTVSEKQNIVASNALSASIASLDDSGAGKKAYKEAIDALDESRSDIKDTLYEHEIDVRIDALDEMKEKSDEYYDEQIDSINEFLNDEIALYRAACNMIDNDNGTLYGNLLGYARTYTTTTEAEFNHMWNSAQTAMQEYNIANLDTFSLLNNLQTRIYEVDGAIDIISDSIASYESKISGIQTKLDNLSSSAQSAVLNISNAMDAENKWQEQQSQAKWYYNWQGTKFESTEANRDKAIQDIIRQIEAKLGGSYPASASSIYGTIKHYAKGTRNSKREVAEINENGQETLFAKTSGGDFALLQPGTQVFTKEQTDVLNDVSDNPDGFISENLMEIIKAQSNKSLIPANSTYEYYVSNRDEMMQSISVARNRMMSSIFEDTNKMISQITNNVKNESIGKSTNISPTIQISIKGDATQSTVNALRAEANNIIKQATNNVMNIALRNKNII